MQIETKYLCVCVIYGFRLSQAFVFYLSMIILFISFGLVILMEKMRKQCVRM